ncbi:MarR family winged helix-turn-helix transcriptional regulator [Nonomuraea sp. NPDC050547]|uniref:MarR family winged helix-turn-helix transcriptional regulator n=1 Tax=unclassified Nonomuraea TaxID=2593643 RepID=UPI0037A674C1
MEEATDPVMALMGLQQRAAALGTVHAEQIARRLGITATDLKCLFLLLQRPHTPRELAAALHLTPSAITSVIDRMVGAGFARREPSQTDRRRYLVTAVPDRAQQAIKLYTPLFTSMRQVLAHYDDDQLATLRDFAQRTVDAFEELTTRPQD